MTHRIKLTLIASFAFCVLLIVGLVAFQSSALGTLEGLYQQSLKRSVEMELATDAQHIGEDLARVIGNAIINRDMVAAARQWDAVKRDSLAMLQKVDEATDIPGEEARVKQAREAIKDIVATYEQELLPLLLKGAAVPGAIADLDARIDRRVLDIDAALQWVAKSMSDDNQRVAGEFRAVLSSTNRLGRIVSMLGIGAALAGFVVTTRLIARPLAELIRAATEVAKGNYLVELEHRSKDETGVLSAAFEAMVRQVRKRTVEMEQSNKDLHREIGDRKLAEEQLQLAYEELQASARATALVKDVRIGERMSAEDLEELALVLKMTRSATNARECGLRLLGEARRAREVEERLTA
jgi:nitrogen fixation/metabolism regulation signal transduction histidine kinase